MTLAKSAALALLLATPALAEIEVTGARLAFEPQALLDTVDELETWLDTNTDLPRAGQPPARVTLIEPGTEVLYEGRMTQLESTVRGLYDEQTGTVYIVRPWFGDRPQDKSVLLHELVHHRQAAAKYWWCPQAMEWDAYLHQEEYLNAHGETGCFNWGWVLLTSSCAPRDHHPD